MKVLFSPVFSQNYPHEFLCLWFHIDSLSEQRNRRKERGREDVKEKGEWGEVGRDTLSLSSPVILLVSTPILLDYRSNLWAIVNLSSILKNLIYAPTLI